MERTFLTSNDVIKIVRKLGFSGDDNLYYKDELDKKKGKAYDFCYTREAIRSFLSNNISKTYTKAIIQGDNNDYNQYPIEEVWKKFFLPRNELIKILNARNIYAYNDLTEEYFYVLNYPDDEDILFK